MELDVTIGAALLAGIISFLSPCVLPLVPPYLCFITGTSLEELVDNQVSLASERRRTIYAALAFVLGFSTVFVALGASASWIGGILREELARTVAIAGWSINPLTAIAGLMMMVMGLHFLGVFRLSWLSRELRYHHDVHPGGLAGSYAIGLAFAFGWTPCIGPVLGTILAIAASEQSLAKGTGLLAVYSLGLGIPFLLAAAGIGSLVGFIAAFRHHYRTIERAMGLLLIASGFLFITGGMQAMAYWLIEQFPWLLKIG
ncbi:MAG: cytochrome c biogenesis protein CcdA [Alphaproteobacteria bacterium]|nr:cytochrome c biogenesis protein CcdA [Alphaproteobacteria bacterium]